MGLDCQLNSSETNPYATAYNDVLGNYALLTSEFFSVPAQKCLCAKSEIHIDMIWTTFFFFGWIETRPHWSLHPCSNI